MQYFVETLTDYLRFDNKIEMDANNLNSVLVQAMAWGGRQQTIPESLLTNVIIYYIRRR